MAIHGNHRRAYLCNTSLWRAVVVCALLVILFGSPAGAVYSQHGGAPSSTSGRQREAFAADMAGIRTVAESQLLAVDLGAEWLKTAVLRVETTPTGAKATPPATSSSAVLPSAITSAAGVHLVLDDQSHRKSAPCVAFRHVRSSNGTYERERAFAASAAALEPRFPLQVICNPSLLLGRTLPSTPAVADASVHGDPTAFRHTIVPLNHLEDGVTGARPSLAVVMPTTHAAGSGADVYTAEELVGMILSYAKRMAEKADAEVNRLTDHEQRALDALLAVRGNQSASEDQSDGEAANTIRHAVLTVPTFATLAQRQALIDAAALAGLRVVRLVHAATAAVVEFAQLRAEQLFLTPASTSTYALIYDMGSRQTEAAVYELTATSATASSPSRVSAITLKALAADHSLGGKAFDRCIAEYWDKTFLENRVFGETPRTPSASVPVNDAVGAAQILQRKEQVSLLRAAQRAREMLSVNREAVITAEGVLSSSATSTTSGPFTTTLSRDTFNEVCASLFEKAVKIRDEAVASLAQSLQEEAAAASADTTAAHTQNPLHRVDHIEVIGGATRMPKLLDVLGRGTLHGVGRRLNGDEAPVLGAVHLGAQAAQLPLPGAIRVSEWLTNDVDFTVRPAATTTAPASVPAHDMPAAGAGERRTRADGVLFPQRTTRLPAMKTVRLQDPRYTTQDFEFEFVSPLPTAPVSDEARQGEPVGYRQTYAVGGVAEAGKRAEEWRRLSVFSTPHIEQEVQPILSEVVLETSVSESGLPRLRAAFLRVVYNKTTTTTTTASAVTATGAERGESEGTAAGMPPAAPDANVSAGGEKSGEVDQEAVIPSADASTVPAASESEKGETNTQRTSRTVVRVFDLQIHPVDTPASPTTGAARSLNLNKAELVRSKATLAALQRQDDLRWLRSALSNDIESLVLHAKSSDAWDDAAAREEPWTRLVQEASLWLEDHGDAATIEELTARKATLMRVEVPARTAQ